MFISRLIYLYFIVQYFYVISYAGCAITPDVNGHVTIPYGIKSIGSAAFYQCSTLKSVSIPDSVTDLGRVAFYQCVALKKLDIPSSVVSIGPH